MRGGCNPGILAEVVMELDIPVEEALEDIGMNNIKVVVNLEYDNEEV